VDGWAVDWPGVDSTQRNTTKAVLYTHMDVTSSYPL
jgi:hypothetical protein